MTTGPAQPPPTLASLTWFWAHAYDIGYRDDQWVAARCDGQAVLAAHTLAGLETVIETDYRYHPVPRDYDPSQAGDYLDIPAGEPGHGLNLPDEHTFPDDELSLDEDTLTVLDHLRDTFPGWAISCSLPQGVWTARTRDTTINQNSAALLSIALTLTERKQHQARNNPRPDP